MKSAAVVLVLCLSVAGPCLAWPEGNAVEAIQRQPDSVKPFIPNPENDIYFLQRNGNQLLFHSREYQPMSSWQTKPTALYVVDATSGALLRTIPTQRTIAFTPQPQGRLVAASEGDGTFRIYDVETGKVTEECKGQDAPRGVSAWSPDGTRFTFEGRFPTILHVYDLRTRVASTIRKNRFVQIWSETWSPDGKSLAILETPSNPLSQNTRTIRILDADPQSPNFGAELAELSVERRDMKGVDRIRWPHPNAIVAWHRDGTHQGLYREAVIEVSSGKTLGAGTAPDESACDTDGLWTYVHRATGATGPFEKVFGFQDPERKLPLPLPLDSAANALSTRYTVIDDTLNYWDRSMARWELVVVADREGHPKFSFSSEGIALVIRSGSTLRVFLSSGQVADYHL